MGCTMVFSSGKKPGIVGFIKMGHQCRNELICRKASQVPMLRGHYYVETSQRHGDLPFMPQTPQGSPGRYNAGTKRFDCLNTSETVKPLSKQTINILRNNHDSSIHQTNIKSNINCCFFGFIYSKSCFVC